MDEKQGQPPPSGRALTAAAVFALVIGSCAVADVNESRRALYGAPVADGARPVQAQVHGSEYGITVALTLHPRRDRAYDGSTVRFDDDVRDDAGYFWSKRWDEVSPPPDPFPAEAGTRVLFVFDAPGECRRPPADSILVRIDSTSATGYSRSDTYDVANLDEYRRAYESRCRQIRDEPVKVALSGCLSRADGSHEITMDAMNFGSSAAVVAFPALTVGSTSWQSASVIVAPGDRQHLVVKGVSDLDEAEVPDSWSDGRLLVNGTPYVMAETGDHWCG